QVIWIGRRPLDDEIQEKISRLAQIGPAPCYIAADAADQTSLQQAYETIRQQFGAIHGVIHSAIVLRDKSLANMDEAQFTSSLAAKVDTSVRLAQVFGGEALDFVLFFSSLQSFTRAAGQSNYAAGCTFQDAFAQRLSHEWPCQIKVMNWGWWGSVGTVAAPAYRQRMAKLGLASIEPKEGMDGLAQLFGSQTGQLALLKTAGQKANVAETIVISPQNYPSVIPVIGPNSRVVFKPDEQSIDTAFRELFQNLLSHQLVAQLQALGLQPDFEGTVTDAATALGIEEQYIRWLEVSFQELARQQYLHSDGQRYSAAGMPVITLDAMWAEWESATAAWAKTPAFRSQIALVETTLQAMTDILCGRKPAVKVIFPDESMNLVESIYKNNPVSDYFNAVLADAVDAFMAERLRHDAQTKLRILELGAGTGGTSATLFDRLRPHAEHMAEYCYTDISPAFLLHAEKEYGGANPYLTCQLFDVTRPLAEQGIETGAYDLVIATNVLHATPDIRQSVRNAKAALRTNGLLMLNEISNGSLFTHLTFGLLKEWWLYEDPELRIPGSPGLSSEKWLTVLADEGFKAIVEPARAAYELGQQIIIAESDGVCRQSAARTPASSIASEDKAAVSPQPTPDYQSQEASDTELRERGITAFKTVLEEVLRVPASKIDGSEPLATYGIDSISVGQLRSALAAKFTDVTDALFFDYQTIEELVMFFLSTQRDALLRWVGSEAREAQQPSQHRPHETPPAETAQQTRSNSYRTAKQPSLANGAEQHHTADRRYPRMQNEPAARTPGAIAIVGMACRFPGAESVDAYWQMLLSNTRADNTGPQKRWPERLTGISHKPPHAWGAFLEDVDSFDPGFFGIPPLHAASIDPQERLFLMSCWHALEDAGYGNDKWLKDFSRTGQDIGVFAGVTTPARSPAASEADLNGAPQTAGISPASIANRVSHTLSLTGPSLTVDTMCSSSLVALHMACECLHSGECSMAIAGGVNLQQNLPRLEAMGLGRLISEDGDCRSFGAGGKGFLPGEGSAALVLKPLDAALHDGDTIHAVIRGSATGHTGATLSYFMPSSQGLKKVMEKAQLHRDAVHRRRACRCRRV
ncbi:MAG: SDR family oxidoreductase, partial [Alphaproteobacteria bacterium]